MLLRLWQELIKNFSGRCCYGATILGCMPKDGASPQSTMPQLGRFSTWEIAIKPHSAYLASSHLLYESSAQQVTQRCTTGFRRIMPMPRML
jgi:hypothetical protein